jgi:hypothetical protein
MPMLIIIYINYRSLFTLIPMVLSCTFWAWRRSEIKPFLSGLYYDVILLEPYKNVFNDIESGRLSFLSVELFAKNP